MSFHAPVHAENHFSGAEDQKHSPKLTTTGKKKIPIIDTAASTTNLDCLGSLETASTTNSPACSFSGTDFPSVEIATSVPTYEKLHRKSIRDIAPPVRHGFKRDIKKVHEKTSQRSSEDTWEIKQQNFSGIIDKDNVLQPRPCDSEISEYQPGSANREVEVSKDTFYDLKRESPNGTSQRSLSDNCTKIDLSQYNEGSGRRESENINNNGVGNIVTVPHLDPVQQLTTIVSSPKEDVVYNGIQKSQDRITDSLSLTLSHNKPSSPVNSKERWFRENFQSHGFRRQSSSQQYSQVQQQTLSGRVNNNNNNHHHHSSGNSFYGRDIKRRPRGSTTPNSYYGKDQQHLNNGNFNYRPPVLDGRYDSRPYRRGEGYQTYSSSSSSGSQRYFRSSHWQAVDPRKHTENENNRHSIHSRGNINQRYYYNHPGNISPSVESKLVLPLPPRSSPRRKYNDEHHYIPRRPAAYAQFINNKRSVTTSNIMNTNPYPAGYSRTGPLEHSILPVQLADTINDNESKDINRNATSVYKPLPIISPSLKNQDTVTNPVVYRSADTHHTSSSSSSLSIHQLPCSLDTQCITFPSSYDRITDCCNNLPGIGMSDPIILSELESSECTTNSTNLLLNSGESNGHYEGIFSVPPDMCGLLTHSIQDCSPACVESLVPDTLVQMFQSIDVDLLMKISATQLYND